MRESYKRIGREHVNKKHTHLARLSNLGTHLCWLYIYSDELFFLFKKGPLSDTVLYLDLDHDYNISFKGGEDGVGYFGVA